MKRARESTSLNFVMNPASACPIYCQLRDFLKREILNRSLAPGDCLPSSRVLAIRLRVSRNTVLSAYEELAAQGLVEGTTGSGTRVRGLVSQPPHMLVPAIPDSRTLLRQAHFPIAAVGVCDPDGTPLYLHR